MASIAKNPNFDFVRAINSEQVPPSFKLEQLRHACSQLNLDFNWVLADARKQAMKEKLVDREAEARLAFREQNNSKQFRTGISRYLPESPVERTYRNDISSIKKVDDPMLRLQMVYALAQKYQGHYMTPAERSSFVMEANPGATLVRASQFGKGGVCRDFSNLLTWSINQVANNPKTGKKEFSADMETAVNHSLTTVTIPPKTSSQWDWGERFSLDPTNFKEFNPIPIPDLLSPDSALNLRRDQCDQIVDCMASESSSQSNDASITSISSPVSSTR